MQAIINFLPFNDNCTITFYNIHSDSSFDAAATMQITEFAQDLIEYAAAHNGTLTYSRDTLEEWINNK